jgi:hypothetical protein
MEGNMFKKAAIASLALTTLLVGPTQAVAQPTCQQMWLTRMYSDASHTVQVGYIAGVCQNPYIQYYLYGTYTYFQTEEPDGTCGCGPIE